MRFAGCAIKSIDKTNVPKNCKILEFIYSPDTKQYNTVQTIDRIEIEYLLAYQQSVDSLDMPLLGIKNCTKLKRVNITQAMLYYDDRLRFDKNTPIYDQNDFHYISKEKSALINQFVQQNTLNPEALRYANHERGYASPLILNQNREEYFIDNAHKELA